MGVSVPVVDIPGNAGTATKLANDSGSPPSYACRAWVNFNGTGTVAIRASGNVSSITDNAVGGYTINFATAMPDANYSAFMAAGTSAGSTGSQINCRPVFDASVSNVSINVFVDSGTPARYDADTVCVSVFR